VLKHVHSKMTAAVVLDADWFVFDGAKHIKQFSYSGLGKSGTYTFSLPHKARLYAPDLRRQARHSHGLVWNRPGDWNWDQTTLAFADLFDALGRRPVELEFYAKGLEKCQLLEQFVPSVTNLEEWGCPKYSALSSLPQTTLSKAVAFDSWLASRMSSPSHN
jgi:hypothetical protein